MWDPARGGTRVVRAMTVGLVVAAVAVGSHVLGGGAHLSWIAVIPATAAVAVIAWALGRRRLGPMILTSLLILAQLGVHALSSYLHGHSPWHDSRMLLAHLLGVAFSALVLAHGDGIVWRLHAWWCRPRCITAPASPVLGRPLAFATGLATPRAPRVRGSGCTRRGPPLPVV